VRLSTVAVTPSAFTTAVELNPEPAIVTVVPYGPLVGEIEETASTVNAFVVAVLPAAVPTVTTPVVAPAGIVV
jgi:hypothetical protein